jgi:hypothetical protein
VTGNLLRKTVAPYLAAGLLCLFLLTLVMNLWELDLSVPLRYAHEGDALLSTLSVKTVVDNGWYFHNAYLGAPGVTELYDFPSSDTVHLTLIKIISLFTGDYAAALNLFFLLTFPLTVLIALFVLRRFGVSYTPALLASLLFAFLPCHFLRGIGHLFLGSYYLVPLAVMVALWVCQGELAWEKLGWGNGLAAWLKDGPARISLIVIILTGSAGVYYTFFTAFFLAAAGLLRAVRIRSLRPLWVTGVLLAVLFATIAINLSPSLVYVHNNGRNAGTAQRQPPEAEVYGMKITQLLLPVAGHRIPFLARIRAGYDATAPLVNENSLATLGAVGSAGLLILLATVLVRWKWHENAGLLNALGALTLGGVLVATVGGFGALFALLVTPQIRAYNRIVVYIAFFALFAVALLLDQWGKRWFQEGGQRWLYSSGLLFLLVFGILDQTTPYCVPRYEELKTVYWRDAEFISRVEASLPKNAMIFQLPQVKFPESAPVEGMANYEHAVGYLHAKTLRWSYGSMYGRYWNAWQTQVAGKSASEMVRGLALAGFQGIYLNRFGYPDRGMAMEKDLERALGVKPLVSGDGRVVFFGMTEFISRLRNEYALNGWQRASEEVLSPLAVQWGAGFSSLEAAQQQNWRWCASKGELWLENPSRQMKTVKLEMVLETGQVQPSRLRVEGPLISWESAVGAAGQSVRKDVAVPPGRHLIRFRSDAKPLDAPGDPRVLVFKVMDFRLSSATAQPLRESWGPGFSAIEKAGDLIWRWCSANGDITIENPSPIARKVSLEMGFATGYPEYSILRIESPLFAEQLKINGAGQPFSKVVTLPPGELKLHFSSDAKRVMAPGDPRVLVFRVMSYRLRDLSRAAETISLN